MPTPTLIAAIVIGATVLILIGLLAVLAYWHGLKHNPFTDCRHCEGTGQRRGVLFTRTFRFCSPCGGSGLTTRLGVRLFNIPISDDQQTIRRLYRDLSR